MGVKSVRFFTVPRTREAESSRRKNEVHPEFRTQLLDLEDRVLQQDVRCFGIMFRRSLSNRGVEVSLSGSGINRKHWSSDTSELWNWSQK